MGAVGGNDLHAGQHGFRDDQAKTLIAGRRGEDIRRLQRRMWLVGIAMQRDAVLQTVLRDPSLHSFTLWPVAVNLDAPSWRRGQLGGGIDQHIKNPFAASICPNPRWSSP